MSNTLNNTTKAWPIGARLRFKSTAQLKPQFNHLRGTGVLVLGGLKDFRHKNDGLRQRVYAFAGTTDWERTGFALPEHLEPYPDDVPKFAETAAAKPCTQLA